MRCRHCGRALELALIDLGHTPLSNAYLTEADLEKPEVWYPLKVMVCEGCWLVQTADFVGVEQIFGADYAYFSSFAESWLAHAKHYVEVVEERFRLGPHSRVVEIAANDGYLLQFVRDKGIPCYGIEPTESTARAARAKGIEIIAEFFGRALAERLREAGRTADLIVANNVLAHVPDINDFVAGFALLLKNEGVATIEFPYLPNLIEKRQFDTIYHEHFSYLSLTAVEVVFNANGLKIFDVEDLPTHGGSLRIYAQRGGSGAQPVAEAVWKKREAEMALGVATSDYYRGLQREAGNVKTELLDFLLRAKREGKIVAAYGAAAKGNTLLNFAGVRADMLGFVVDRNPAKQGKYLPGSHIPITAEERLRERRPDYVVLLPWNLKAELLNQLAYIRDWGGKFITAIPKLNVE
jgi:2-polyprenyl-3-methyl-5-hydroxy-6-metoxy-1,4-benzoquinol methylase